MLCPRILGTSSFHWFHEFTGSRWICKAKLAGRNLQIAIDLIILQSWKTITLFLKHHIWCWRQVSHKLVEKKQGHLKINLRKIVYTNKLNVFAMHFCVKFLKGALRHLQEDKFWFHNIFQSMFKKRSIGRFFKNSI